MILQLRQLLYKTAWNDNKVMLKVKRLLHIFNEYSCEELINKSKLLSG